MFKAILKIAEAFIPPETKSKDDRIRARISVIFLLVVGSFVVINIIVATILRSATAGQLAFRAILLAVWAWGLYRVKKLGQIEHVMLATLCIGTIFITLEMVFSIQSFLSPSMRYFPIALLCGFLTCKKRSSRVIVVICVALCNIACIVMANRIGFAIPRAVSHEAFSRQIILSMIFNSIMTVILMHCYIQIRSFAKKELEQEMSLLLRNMKLEEISELVRLMSPQLERTLKEVRLGIERMKGGKTEVSDPMLDHLGRGLEQIAQISQTLGWFYRAYHKEDLCSAGSTSVLRQVRMLMQSRALEMGWSLEMSTPEDEYEMRGPIPSLVLLLLTIGTHIMEGGEDEKLMRIEMEHASPHMIWRFSWCQRSPKSILQASDAAMHGHDYSRASLRREFIAELIQQCRASLSEVQLGGRRHLMITCEWQDERETKQLQPDHLPATSTRETRAF